MTKINHPNLGEITNTQFVTGVVTDVYSADDTCDLTLYGVKHSGIPLFYHCNPTVVQRSNGAMTGAAGAFHAGDTVIIQLLDNIVKRVVGFQSGLKPCEGCTCLADVNGELMGDWYDVDMTVGGPNLGTLSQFPAATFTASNPDSTTLLIQSGAYSGPSFTAEFVYRVPASWGAVYLLEGMYSHSLPGAVLTPGHSVPVSWLCYGEGGYYTMTSDDTGYAQINATLSFGASSKSVYFYRGQAANIGAMGKTCETSWPYFQDGFTTPCGTDVYNEACFCMIKQASASYLNITLSFIGNSAGIGGNVAIGVSSFTLRGLRVARIGPFDLLPGYTGTIQKYVTCPINT